MQYVGIVLLVIAVGLLLWRRSQQGRLRAILGAETSTVKEITELGSYVRAGLDGHTAFSRVCKLQGVVGCDSPLTSEVAQQPCVYYSMSVTREYEETYTETDNQGRQQQRTRNGSETVAHNSRRVPFWLEDGGSRIPVDPDGAEIDAEQVAERYEPAGLAQLGLSLGGLQLVVGGAGGRRTLGHRYRESLLPLGRRAFVLGEASDSSGTLTVQKSQQKGVKFIITLKSQEQLVGSAQRTINWLLYGATASAVLGVAALVFGLARA
ncbi:MAG: E3 ubiquitin ligase family protein [Chloroflexota bacterium]